MIGYDCKSNRNLMVNDRLASNNSAEIIIYQD